MTVKEIALQAPPAGPIRFIDQQMFNNNLDIDGGTHVNPSTLSVTVTPAVTMRVAQISTPGGDFELIERALPEPNARQVRMKVHACEVCHSEL